MEYFAAFLFEFYAEITPQRNMFLFSIFLICPVYAWTSKTIFPHVVWLKGIPLRDLINLLWFFLKSRIYIKHSVFLKRLLKSISNQHTVWNTMDLSEWVAFFWSCSFTEVNFVAKLVEKNCQGTEIILSNFNFSTTPDLSLRTISIFVIKLLRPNDFYPEIIWFAWYTRNLKL